MGTSLPSDGTPTLDDTAPADKVQPMTQTVPWRDIPDGIELVIRVTPRGGGARIEGIAEWDGQPILKVRVAAPPVEGAANDAIVTFLAKALHLPRSAVTLIAGDRARVKRLRLTGAGLADRLSALVPTT